MGLMLKDVFKYCSTSGILGALRDRGPKPDAVRNVLSAPTLPAAVQAVISLPFADEMDLPGKPNLQQVEHIIRLGQLRCIEKLERFAWKPMEDLLIAMMLRYDLRNLKVIRRWIAHKQPTDAALLLYPHRLSFLNRCDGIPDSAPALREALRKSPVRRIFDGAESRYASNRNLFEFDLALDVGWLRMAVDLLGRIESPILTACLGGQSITNVLWLKFYRGLSPEETFHSFVPVPHFYDTDTYWRLASAESPAEFIEKLSPHPLVKHVRETGAEIETAADLSKEVRRCLWSLIQRRRSGYAFDAEALVAFLLGWELIGDDLVIALQAKHLGMERDRFSPLLTTIHPGGNN